MRILILLRHAKSEEPGFVKPDYERKLKEKGVRDINKVASEFIKLNLNPAIILCSSATRTRETLDELLKYLQPAPEIRYLESLYHASASEILDLINSFGKDSEIIMEVGHNFGISQLADYLSRDPCRELPTSGLIVLGFEKDIEMGKGKILHLIIPKEI